MRNRYLLLIILLLLFLSLSVNASNHSSDFPVDQISVDMSFGSDLSGNGGSSYVNLQDGWSSVINRKGGFQPNLIYLFDLDLPSVFGKIDFSQVDDWQYSQNNDVMILDAATYSMVIEISLDDGSVVELDFNGQGDRSTFDCNIEAACDFILAFLDLVIDNPSNFATIITIDIISLSFVIFLAYSLYLPYRFRKQIADRSNDRLFRAFEVLALFMDLVIFFTLLQSLLPYIGFFSVLPIITVSLVVEFFIFRWYYRILWIEDEEEISLSEVKNEIIVE